MAQALPSARDMIARLIATPSVSSTLPEADMGNRGVVDLVADWSDSLGFAIEMQSVSDGKYNLIARAGDGSDGLVLSGHTDTVPCDPALWTSDPFEARETDDRIYGLGSCDMKSFLALALAASSKYDFGKLKRPLTIVATADEESTMNGARLIADTGKKLGRYCVIGEPTSLVPVHQHKGCLTLSMRFDGQSGHASDPSLGNSALESMHEFIRELFTYRERLQKNFTNPAFAIPTPTMNLGHIHGGDSSNRICGSCTLMIDIRFLPGMSVETLKSEIDDIAAQVADRHGQTCVSQVYGSGGKALYTDEASEIAQALTALSGKNLSAVGFGTEAPYFNSMQTETIVIGPGSINQAHQPDEYLPLGHIEPTIHLLDALIDRFCMA